MNPKLRRRAPARVDVVDCVPVRSGTNDYPDFAPSHFVDRDEDRPWDVESLWLAAAKWSRHHGLPDAAARAAFIAYASAYDRATGQALDGPQGFTTYGPRSLRRTELRMRHARHDPEVAAFAARYSEEADEQPTSACLRTHVRRTA